MWTTRVTRKTTATKEQLWELWSDVSNWNTWDHEIEYSEISGEFKVGTKGVLKPAGGPKTKFVITVCNPLQEFSDRSFLPLSTMDFVHTIREIPDGLEVSHEVRINGPLTFLFSRVIGKKIESSLPQVVEKLIYVAESKEYGKTKI